MINSGSLTGSMVPMRPIELKLTSDIIELKAELAEVRRDADACKVLAERSEQAQVALQSQLLRVEGDLGFLRSGGASAQLQVAPRATSGSSSEWQSAIQSLEMQMSTLKSNLASQLASPSTELQSGNAASVKELHGFGSADNDHLDRINTRLQNVEQSQQNFSQEIAKLLQLLNDYSDRLTTTLQEIDKHFENVVEQVSTLRSRTEENMPLPGQESVIEKRDAFEDKRIDFTERNENTHVYMVQSSIWECGILLFNPLLNVGAHILLVFGLVFNIAIQLLLCMIVHANLVSAAIDDTTVEAMKRWRATVGHSAAFVDPLKGTSLTTQLCNQDYSSSFAASQFVLYGDIASFLKTKDSLITWLNGHFLCYIALLIWMFCIFSDANDNVRFASAVMSIPRGPPCLMHSQDGMRVLAFSMLQFWSFLLLSAIPRALISCYLGYMGVRFLAAYTANISDLVLNAMALEFILEIDEVTFDAMVPHRVKTVMWKLLPLDMGAMTRKLGRLKKHFEDGEVSVAIRMFILGVLLMVFHYKLIDPIHQQMKDAERWLCDGRQDFAIVVNKASGTVYFAETKRFVEESEVEYAGKIALSLTGLLASDLGLVAVDNMPVDSDSNWWHQYASIATHMQLQGVKDVNARDVDFSAQMTFCFDFSDNLEAFVSNVSFDVAIQQVVLQQMKIQATVMRSHMHNESLVLCEAWQQPLCYNRGMNFLRASCPDLCGCTNPWSGNYYATVSFGCSFQCASVYQNALLDLNLPGNMKRPLSKCWDVPLYILSNNSEWRQYVKTLQEDSTLTKDEPGILASKLGCRLHKAAKHEIGRDLCTISTLRRTIRAWCPRTCGCQARMEECPSSCA